jgi:IMP dehydrogenase
MEIKKGYDYDDVLLVPKSTDLNSRQNVIMTDWQGMYPIFSSPMKWISGTELVMAGHKARIYGTLHRFYEPSERVEAIDKLNAITGSIYGVAVGLDKGEDEFAKYAWEHGAEYICVDVANGYLRKVANFVEGLRKNGIDRIVVGNVATKEGADALYESGAVFIRVGIGGGHLCTTRNITGVGVPDLTAIEDVNLSRYRSGFHLIADGGIHNSGNAVKAFAVGADYVMLGSYLAQAYEAEHTDGNIYGMASAKLQNDMNKSIVSVEGTSKVVEKIAPLEKLIAYFVGGIRSACTYLNSSSYMDIKYNAEFIAIGNGTLKHKEIK